MDTYSLISGVVGVLAFILAIPLAIVANILTPKILAWWAKTSTVRRDKRIIKLKREIIVARLDMHPLARRQALIEALKSVLGVLLGLACLEYISSIDAAFSHAMLEKISGADIFPSGALNKDMELMVYRLQLLGINGILVIVLYLINRSLAFLQKSSRPFLENRLEAMQSELRTLSAQIQ